MASAVSNQPDAAKHVNIYMNGNVNVGPKKVLVSKKKTKDLDTFCDSVTLVLKPQQGCVRSICTPIGGTRITDLDSMEPGGNYVALCNNKFAKLP